MDSASMLIARRTLPLIDDELRGVARSCAGLAGEHRATPMAGRTLLQQALPVTFGLKAAGWLAGVGEARERLAAVEPAAELGGAAGTLASLGGDGVRVLQGFAGKLGLAEPVLPWHTSRARVGELGAALALVAGALEKVALDVTLMAQTEVGELAESSAAGAAAPRRSPTSATPSARCAAARARAWRGRRPRPCSAAMAQEHERASTAPGMPSGRL